MEIKYTVNMKKMLGFIDESGSYGFDFEKSDVSSHFIVTCIIIAEEKLNEIENAVELVRKKYFQSGEMKSSKVKANHSRRILILKELARIDFKIFALVVDKQRIYDGSGLNYKKSFIKYLNGILYNDLTNYYPKLELSSDELGTKEFMSEFRNYLIKNHAPNLLGEYDVAFVNSKSNVLIQLADFISGTIAFGFEKNKCCNEYKEFYEIIKERLLPIILWPKEAENYIKNLQRYIRVDYDERIAYTSIKIALKFVEDNENSKDIDIKVQVLTLKYLLNVLLNQGENRYVISEEIKNNLLELTGRDYSSHYFQTKIIAPLRDSGVLIATSQKGYKIPIKEKEILSFINQSSSIIKPMIQRIKICRERVLKATNNEVDIFDYDEYKYLDSIINKEEFK